MTAATAAYDPDYTAYLATLTPDTDPLDAQDRAQVNMEHQIPTSNSSGLEIPF